VPVMRRAIDGWAELDDSIRLLSFSILKEQDIYLGGVG